MDRDVKAYFVCLLGLAAFLLSFPVCSTLFEQIHAKEVRHIAVNSERMRRDVRVLTSITPARNAYNIASLDKSADYITAEFGKTGCRIDRQYFSNKDKRYQNIVCSFGPEDAERIVIGAHYDVKGEQPGADDNASGVAGMLEIARLIGETKAPIRHRVDLVAFTLEEREFLREPLRTRKLGSYTYAKGLHESGARVRLMMALEMIGYFSDKPGSQRYPLFLKWFYPDKGNYIAVVGSLGEGLAVQDIKRHMSAACRIPVESLSAPSLIPGVNFSDHHSFWRFGYRAIMITDTAFYRNPNYHRATDTVETLDFGKMAEVVKGVYWTIDRLDQIIPS